MLTLAEEVRKDWEQDLAKVESGKPVADYFNNTRN